MDNHHSESSAGHAGYGSEPSAWPILAGVAALVLGTALLWWSRDDNSFAGPLLSASLVATLVAVCGWAYDDTRAKRRGASHGAGARESARYTQVITFAVAEGQMDAARAADGVIGRVESADTSLRKLAGFIDLRIVVSPSTSGPSQVLVETSWSDREGLATYEETRRTVLDLVAGLDQQVIPGSTQVFDMVVVRDTKDIAVRIGGGAAATLVGALAIGGLLVGAGLTIFTDEGGGGGGGEAPVPTGFAQTGSIVARSTKFTETAISLPPKTEVTIRLDNKDASPPHNIQFFAGPETTGPLLTGCKSGCPAGDVMTAIATGPVVQEFTFTTPGPGTYAYNCVVHPVEMRGALTIAEGTPLPGAAPAAAGGESAGGGNTVVAKDTKFSSTALTAAANTEVTIKFDNKDATPPHNIQFFAGAKAEGALLTGCTKGCAKDTVETPIEAGPKVYEITFKAPAPGKYAFNCVVHPDQMKGTLTIG